MFRTSSLASAFAYIWVSGLVWGLIFGGIYGALIAHSQGISAYFGTFAGAIFGMISGFGSAVVSGICTVFFLRRHNVGPLRIMIRSGFITVLAYWLVFYSITDISPFDMPQRNGPHYAVLFSFIPGLIAAVVSALVSGKAARLYYDDNKPKRKNYYSIDFDSDVD